MLKMKSREDVLKLAEEFGYAVTFDNKPEDVGVVIEGKLQSIEDVMQPFYDATLFKD